MLEEVDQEKIDEIRDKIRSYLSLTSASTLSIYDISESISFLESRKNNFSQENLHIFKYGGKFENFIKLAEVSGSKLLYYQGWGDSEEPRYSSLMSSEEIDLTKGALFFFKNNTGDIHLFVITYFSPPYSYFENDNETEESDESEEDLDEQEKGLERLAQEVLKDPIYIRAKNQKQRSIALYEFMKVRLKDGKVDGVSGVSTFHLERAIELAKLKQESIQQQKLI